MLKFIKSLIRLMLMVVMCMSCSLAILWTSVAYAETEIVRPLPSFKKITSAFQPKRELYIDGKWQKQEYTHLSTDYSADAKTEVRAIADGYVYAVIDWTKADKKEGGNIVVLKHDINGMVVYSRYQHLYDNTNPYVKKGQYVSAGQQIGRVGNTGYSTGPHLHIQIWSGDYTVYLEWGVNKPAFSKYKYGKEEEGPITYSKYTYYNAERVFAGKCTIGTPYYSIKDTVEQQAYCTSSTCEIKLGPRAGSTTITTLNQGDSVELMGSVQTTDGHTWYMVKTLDLGTYTANGVGFIAGEHLSVMQMEKVQGYVTSTKKATYDDTDDQCYVKDEPYEASATKDILGKGESVFVDAKVTNDYGNVWYRTTNGMYIYSGDVTFTSYTYTEDWKELCKLRASFTHNESVNSHLLPYADSPKRSSITKGDTVTVVRLVTNRYNNIWAELSDGTYVCFYDKSLDKTHMTFKSLTDGFTETASKPTGSLKPGKAFELTGEIKANAPIYQVTAYVIEVRENGTAIDNALPPVSIKPGNFAYSANLNKKYNGVNINYSVIFNDLPVGRFRYVVTAQLGFTYEYNDKLFLLGYETAVVNSLFTVGTPGEDGPTGDIVDTPTPTPVPTVPVQSIVVTNEKRYLSYGDPYEFQWEVYPENATNKDVTWTSSNENVIWIPAMVDGIVDLFYVGCGTTTITVSANDGSGVSYSFDVNVQPVLDYDFWLDSEALIGDLHPAQGGLTIKTLPEYTKLEIVSNDESVATVSYTETAPGQFDISVTPVSHGTTSIGVWVWYGGVQSAFGQNITVRDFVFAESIDAYGIPDEMKVGDVAELYYAINPADTDCTGSGVESSDSTILEVVWQEAHYDEYGRYIMPLKAHAPGKATIKIRATDGSGVYVTHIVTVKPVSTPTPPAGCQHGNVVIDAVVYPTCTEYGWTEGSHCGDCGEVLIAQERLVAYGHRESERIVVTEPSATMPGSAMIICRICEEIIQMEEIPPLGDSRVPGDANDDAVVNIYDALLIIQYDAGWNVSLNTSNADVNADNSVDIYDALLILQYGAGWNVVLK